MGFRENLKNEMEYQGITTKELSKKSGVNKRTLDHYLMNNPQEPSVTNAFNIAKALNVTVEFLLTGTNTTFITVEQLDIIRKFNILSEEKKNVLQNILSIFAKS